MNIWENKKIFAVLLLILSLTGCKNKDSNKIYFLSNGSSQVRVVDSKVIENINKLDKPEIITNQAFNQDNSIKIVIIPQSNSPIVFKLSKDNVLDKKGKLYKSNVSDFYNVLNEQFKNKVSEYNFERIDKYYYIINHEDSKIFKGFSDELSNKLDGKLQSFKLVSSDEKYNKTSENDDQYIELSKNGNTFEDYKIKYKFYKNGIIDISYKDESIYNLVLVDSKEEIRNGYDIIREFIEKEKLNPSN